MPATQKILINVLSHETRVAVVVGQVLQDLQIERNHGASLVGNIYKAKVTRVLPEMQAAFIDIGQSDNGFLHAAELAFGHNHQVKKSVLIEDVLHQGNLVWVQVIRDAFGDKGPRLTMHLSLSSKNLVYRPHVTDVGISHKIVSQNERLRLQSQLQEALLKNELTGGFTIRTEAATTNDFSDDVAYLKHRWDELKQTMKNAKAGTMVYQESCLAMRTIRDVAPTNDQSIELDSATTYAQAIEFATHHNVEVVDKISLYAGATPLFDKHLVEEQIDQALQNRVGLASGANIFIEQTESMTTIDINTASNIGQQKIKKSSAADFAYQTNLEAIDEIAHQLRLRNLAGIIVIDFIDMKKSEHKKALVNALELALSNDPMKITIGKISTLGLIEITRQRIRPSLEQVIREDCSVCSGIGRVKTSTSICYDILRGIKREAQKYKASAYTVVAAETIIDMLRKEHSQYVIHLQESIERPINLQLEASYQQQQFDIVLS